MGRSANTAFITDFGQNLTVTHEDGTQTSLERYGVWRRSARGKHEVVEVGNDLPALMKQHGVPESRVIPIDAGETQRLRPMAETLKG